MDWQLTCRVCLESGDMVSLFDWDDNNEQLANKYKYCCGVEVLKNDTLPTLICLNCVDRLTFSYQFKQQCLLSIDTLKECLEEFEKTTAAASETVAASASTSKEDTETITIKQENGVLLQYELPIEHEPTWTRVLSKSADKAVVTKAPGPKKRGRPRKYPNELGEIEMSPYQRKKPKPKVKEVPSLKSLLQEGAISASEMKQEPEDELPDELNDDEISENDPDFQPDDAAVSDLDVKDVVVATPKKRGRPRKNISEESAIKDEQLEAMNPEDEDMLLKETIMAISEPIPEHILNPKPKKKPTKEQRKKYYYDKIHICETCGASFASNASLQAHIRRHLGIKPFVCSICGYSCVLNMELRRHMLRHTGQKPYKCRICDRRFGDFGSRQKHESVCGYACVDREALKRHMFRHTGEKPYQCRICERSFRDFGTRQKHERLHMGLRPYKCSVCGKSFTYSYVLANHMLTHTGEKKYQCVPCNKKFTKAHHLKYHNKVHHKDVYAQQQLELEAKRVKQQISLTDVSGVISAQIVDGNLQIVNEDHDGEENEQDCMMHVVEVDGADRLADDAETHRAVAGMQVVLDSDFVIKKI